MSLSRAAPINRMQTWSDHPMDFDTVASIAIDVSRFVADWQFLSWAQLHEPHWMNIQHTFLRWIHLMPPVRSNDISAMLCCSNSFRSFSLSPLFHRGADFPNSTLTLQKKIGRERIIGGKCWVAGHEERSSESVYIWRSKQRALSYLYCEVGSCSRPGQRHECRTEEEVQNVTWKPNIYRALITVLLVFVYLLLNSAIQ